jgi:hypothetical protein
MCKGPMLKLFTVGALCGSLAAQTNANKGSIEGFVYDSAGAAVPQASVQLVGPATGFELRTLTTGSGTYEFASLEPGNYDIKVESAGFGTSVERITVDVGATLRVNVRLTLTANAETVNVSSNALSLAESVPTDVMTNATIESLPIDGRRFQDFATLSPSVEALTETLGQLSFAGQRGIYSNVMLDGADYNEPLLGGIRGGDRSDYAFTIPQSAIDEFQAVLTGPSVEYGHTTGGILNATTRSGTNNFHGDAFYQFRDQSLSATDPLGLQPLDSQHQFGGDVGGPIIQNRLFFFAAVEQQLGTFPRTVSYPGLDAFAGQITPAIAPAYNYLTSLAQPFDESNNATAVFGRADYQSSRGDRLSIHYNYSRNNAQNAIAPGATTLATVNQAIDSNGTDRETVTGGGGQWTSMFPGSAMNNLRVQYIREESNLIPNAISPYVDLGSLGAFGTAPNLPAATTDYRFQVADGVSLLKGRHSFSFGIDYSYIGVAQTGGDDQFGAFTITADPLTALEVLSGADGNNRFDDPSVTYTRQVGGLHFSGNAHQPAAYALDSWRITPSLTVSAGVRWEGQINPQPITNNAFLVSNVLGYPFPRGQLNPTLINNPLNQWSPRSSFAWDPTGRQTTVIRGKAGLFYAQTPLIYLAGPITDLSMAPANLTLTIAPNAGGTVYQQFLAGGFNFNNYALNNLPVFSVDDVWVNVAGKPNPFAQANVVTTTGGNFQNPRSAQAGLSVEHRISNGLVVFYELSHLNTVHLERNVDWNVPLPFIQPGDLSLRPFFGLRSGTPRPNPNLSSLLVRDSSARATYTGHTFRIEYRRGRVQLSASYTLSFNKSDDDNERQLTGITYQNPYNFQPEYNWSAIDARHQVAGYITWRAPWGFELSALGHFRSGLPIDASTGGDTSQLLSGDVGNRPMVLPGVPMLRDAFRNLSYQDVDLRISKTIIGREILKLKAYGDLFNAFNFGNMAFISATIDPNNPAFIYGLGVLPNGQPAPVNPGFLKQRLTNGQYDSATMAQQGSPLQAQLGLKLIF